MLRARDKNISIYDIIYGQKSCTNFHTVFRAWKESRLITLAYFHLSTRHGRITSLLSSFYRFLSFCCFVTLKLHQAPSARLQLGHNLEQCNYILIIFEWNRYCKWSFFAKHRSLCKESGFSSTSESLEAPEVDDGDRMRNPQQQHYQTQQFEFLLPGCWLYKTQQSSLNMFGTMLNRLVSWLMTLYFSDIYFFLFIGRSHFELRN